MLSNIFCLRSITHKNTAKKIITDKIMSGVTLPCWCDGSLHEFLLAGLNFIQVKLPNPIIKLKRVYQKIIIKLKR